MGGAGFGGQGMGGGMYGTGRGMGKKAGASPTDWNSDSGMPTGFHRPTHIQPESLEAGAERFHATESSSVVPEVDRRRHGLIEGGQMRVRPTSSPQMGKQAAYEPPSSVYYKAPKPAGPSGNWLQQRGQEYAKSMKQLVRGSAQEGKSAVSAIDRLSQSVTTSPMASALATLAAAGLGFRGARGLGRRVFKGAQTPSAPPAKGAIRKAIDFLTR
jgi:hypothetical protein